MNYTKGNSYDWHIVGVVERKTKLNYKNFKRKLNKYHAPYSLLERNSNFC